MSAEDFAVRATLTDAVLALFLSRPGVWIDVHELAQVGGFCGFRTRVSEARKRFERDYRGTVVWNGKQRSSAYRYVPVVPPPVPAMQMEMFR